jgi:lysophospholipase L1-like esterase
MSKAITAITALVSLLIACKGSGSGSSGESFGHEPSTPQDKPPGDGTGTQPAPASTGDAGIDPGPPAVQLIGRFDTLDVKGPRCAWPGCRVIARFEGTRVSVRLREKVETWMDGGPSEWDVAVDGVWKPKIVTNATGAAQSYVIDEALADGPHVVELYRRSEAANGTTQFLGYDFGGGKLLPPPPRMARRIEMVGDSIVSGYGVEGVGLVPACPPPGYAARYENFRVTMGARLGEIFGAEVAGTAFSGKGVARNAWVEDKDTLPVLFERSLPNDPKSKWEFSKFVPDIVVVMAGGNDFAIGLPVDQGPATLTEFTAAYGTLLAALRREYPAAHLLVTVPPPVTDIEPPGRNTRTNVVTGVNTVVAQRNAIGDAKVYAFEPERGDASEHTGCDGHPNAQFHERVAKELAAEIRARVGWN